MGCKKSHFLYSRGLSNLLDAGTHFSFSVALLDKKWTFKVKAIALALSIGMLCANASAQKIRVGYDKGTDFHKFKTYSWGEPNMPPTRPLLYASMIGSVDEQLKAKGLTRVSGEGDLVLTPAGGMDFGLNVAAASPAPSTYGATPAAIDTTNWAGATGPPILMAPHVSEGTLVLTFVERATNKVVWTGTVNEKLDLENKKKSVERVDEAIIKLLRQFPPQASRTHG
jgi:hypothetical protein